jgi:hypothetical protein
MRTTPMLFLASKRSLRIRGNNAMAKWTREKIIREILRREAEGLPLALGGSRDGIESKMYQAGSRIFGSWGNAITAAGIAPERGKSHDSWPPSKILAKIRSLARRRHPPRPGELKRRYSYLMDAARRHFGSWTKAIVAAGVDPEKLRRVKPWTKERIIEAILTRALHSEPLGSTTVRPRSLAEAGARVFGSWKAAMEEAGIDPEVARRESEMSNQRSPRRPSRSHRRAAANRQAIPCESPSNAKQGGPAGGPARRRRAPGKRWSEQEIVEAIRARRAEGKRMNSGAVGEEDDPLYRAAMRRYGSWQNALLVAEVKACECRQYLGSGDVPGNDVLRSDS